MITFVFIFSLARLALAEPKILLDQLANDDRTRIQSQLTKILEEHPKLNPKSCELDFVKEVHLKHSALKQEVIKKLQSRQIIYFDLKEKTVDVVEEAKRNAHEDRALHYFGGLSFLVDTAIIRARIFAEGEKPQFVLIFPQFVNANAVPLDQIEHLVMRVNPEISDDDFYVVDKNNLDVQGLYDFYTRYFPDDSKQKILSKLTSDVKDGYSQKISAYTIGRPLTTSERYQQHLVSYSVAKWNCQHRPHSSGNGLKSAY